jgi:hypothetical protein
MDITILPLIITVTDPPFTLGPDITRGIMATGMGGIAITVADITGALIHTIEFKG